MADPRVKRRQINAHRRPRHTCEDAETTWRDRRLTNWAHHEEDT